MSLEGLRARLSGPWTGACRHFLERGRPVVLWSSGALEERRAYNCFREVVAGVRARTGGDPANSGKADSARGATLDSASHEPPVSAEEAQACPNARLPRAHAHQGRPPDPQPP